MKANLPLCTCECGCQQSLTTSLGSYPTNCLLCVAGAHRNTEYRRMIEKVEQRRSEKKHVEDQNKGE